MSTEPLSMSLRSLPKLTIHLQHHTYTVEMIVKRKTGTTVVAQLDGIELVRRSDAVAAFNTTLPTAPAEPADPVTEVAALPDVSDLLTWAVEDGLIRLSRVFDPDLQDAITKFATRLAALQANDTTKGE